MEASHAGAQGGEAAQRKEWEDGGVRQQRERELAEEAARDAARTGDTYGELLAKGMRYASKQDPRREAKAYREAIALRPDKPVAYFNLGAALASSGHYVEAAQRYLEARERFPVGSARWAQAMARAFSMLVKEACAEVAKPEWWSDEGLKSLLARVVRVAPDDFMASGMRASVLSGLGGDAWGAGPRSASELRKAATHYQRAAALCSAPLGKAEFTDVAERCRRRAQAI